MNENKYNSDERRPETGRILDLYAQELFFDPELLVDKKVLNLGSGSSNLKKDLKKSKIDSSVTDLDLTHDPHKKLPTDPLRTKIAELVGRHMTGEKKTTMIRKIWGTENRQMIQADMGDLPFSDKSFDLALACYSTYQVPSEKKRKVFSEMLRVADAVHVGPILKEDLYIFVELIEQEHTDFEIVLFYPSNQSNRLFLGENKFSIKEESDYQNILDGDMGTGRIYEPEIEETNVYSIVLKRKKNETLN